MNKTAIKRMTTAANKLMKSAGRVYRHMAEDHALLYTVDGRTVACDSYRALRFPVDLPDLPHAIHNDWGRSVVKIIDQNKKICIELVPLPSVGSIKQAIAEKQKHIPLGPLHVNPRYLLDMVRALPKAGAWINPKGGYSSPIYFCDEDGADGLLMPVRVV